MNISDKTKDKLKDLIDGALNKTKKPADSTKMNTPTKKDSTAVKTDSLKTIGKEKDLIGKLRELGPKQIIITDGRNGTFAPW